MLDARIRVLLQYRTAAIAGIGTQIFFGFVRVMTFTAFYRASTAVQPLTHGQVVSYIWLGQAFLLLAMFGVDSEIAEMIRSGTVAYELTRPASVFWLWYSRCVAARIAPTAMRGIPQLLLGWAFLGLQFPASVSAFVMFCLALAGSVALAGAISLLFTLSLLWTISGEGVSRLGPAVVFLLSGIVVPLPLFPPWMQPVLNVLPFRGLMDVPFRLYLGQMPWHEGALALGQQWGWTAGLLLLGRRLLALGVRRLTVQGG
jgi:ABC-2 type transport system permease protein